MIRRCGARVETHVGLPTVGPLSESGTYAAVFELRRTCAGDVVAESFLRLAAHSAHTRGRSD